MKLYRLSERTREALEKLPPDKRHRAEAIIALTQTLEARATTRPTVLFLTGSTARQGGSPASAKISTPTTRPRSARSSRPYVMNV
jgi:hypothetical protein